MDVRHSKGHASMHVTATTRSDRKCDCNNALVDLENLGACIIVIQLTRYPESKLQTGIFKPAAAALTNR